MRSLLSKLMVILPSLTLCNCVTVTTFSEEPQAGGELEVSAVFADVDGSEAREKMTALMRNNCYPHPYKIIRKGKVKVGSRTSTGGREDTSSKTTSTYNDLYGSVTHDPGTSKSISSSSMTEDAYAWRVTYKCLKK